MTHHFNPSSIMKPVIFFILICFLCSCSDDSHQEAKTTSQLITRKSDEYRYHALPSHKLPPPTYPWEEGIVSDLPRITKEYFRCKGSPFNPERITEQNGKTVRIRDCGGSEKHSLPLRNQREFIYPILIDLLNYLQQETGKKVVITSGHRCPEHNAYVIDFYLDRYSKHMIGAEVSFYVQGMEYDPQKVVDLLLNYYRNNPKYVDQTPFTLFYRYEKSDTNVSTQPWYNKEIFIKLFKEDEGRNADNRHPYPYLSIQVRYDTDLDERVAYSWDKAYKNFLRK